MPTKSFQERFAEAWEVYSGVPFWRRDAVQAHLTLENLYTEARANVTAEQAAAAMRDIETAVAGGSSQTITTRYNQKPDPIRNYDWEAVEGEYDLGKPIGFGATEQEAIADLQAQLEDHDPLTPVAESQP